MRTKVAGLANEIGRSIGMGVNDMQQGKPAVLESVNGAGVALKGVNVEAELSDLLAEVSITQTYTNEESVNIEAVYTFPLPTYATLLDLTVTINGRPLKGVIVGKEVAEDRYEDAITEGDTAIMLQQLEPGLYTMNVGNLQAGETAVIQFRYALLLHWSGDQLRFMLPTVIAPRYGDPVKQGLQPHQTPDWDLSMEHPYSLRVRVKGLLGDGDIESPSHKISVARSDTGTVIHLTNGSATLDRDFVLNFRATVGQSAAAQADCDIDGYVALATFRPLFDDITDASPRSVKIVIDCSGSMGGDSIEQAREALLRILDSLRPQDYFNIVRFGSRHHALFPALVAAAPNNLRRAKQVVLELDADMGGTEIGEALQSAYGLQSQSDIPPDLLLITDGEVWNADPVIKEAKNSGHRIFTVGVGASVAETFVRSLAEKCGGMCELVTPNEDMTQRIHRHFERMYAPRAQDVTITWPTKPKSCLPEVPGPVYHGDTMHMLAWFNEPPVGDVSLDVTLPNGRQISQTAEITCETTATDVVTQAQALPGTLARLAAAKKLVHMTGAKATKLAVRYQLISPHTHYLVIDEREIDDKAEDLPALRKMSQMLAAGWGGTGSVSRKNRMDLFIEPVSSMQACRPASCERPSVVRRKMAKASAPDGDIGYLDIPAFLRREVDPDLTDLEDRREKRKSVTTEAEMVNILNQCSPDWLTPCLRIRTLLALRGMGLSVDIILALEALVQKGLDESQVVIVFLNLLAESNAGTNLKREARRSITKAYKDSNPAKKLVDKVKRALHVIPQYNNKKMSESDVALKSALDNLSAEARPFVSYGNPLESDVIIVGLNPATGGDIQWRNYWEPPVFYGDRWRNEIYLSLRGQSPSPTWRNMKKLEDAAVDLTFTETNIYSMHSRDAKSLENYDTSAFDTLLEYASPKLVIPHGKEAVEYLEKALGIAIEWPGKGKQIGEYTQAENFEVLPIKHLRYQWSYDGLDALGLEINNRYRE